MSRASTRQITALPRRVRDRVRGAARGASPRHRAGHHRNGTRYRRRQGRRGLPSPGHPSPGQPSVGAATQDRGDLGVRLRLSVSDRHEAHPSGDELPDRGGARAADRSGSRGGGTSRGLRPEVVCREVPRQSSSLRDPRSRAPKGTVDVQIEEVPGGCRPRAWIVRSDPPPNRGFELEEHRTGVGEEHWTLDTPRKGRFAQIPHTKSITSGSRSILAIRTSPPRTFTLRRGATKNGVPEPSVPTSTVNSTASIRSWRIHSSGSKTSGRAARASGVSKAAHPEAALTEASLRKGGQLHVAGAIHPRVEHAVFLGPRCGGPLVTEHRDDVGGGQGEGDLEVGQRSTQAVEPQDVRIVPGHDEPDVEGLDRVHHARPRSPDPPQRATRRSRRP